MKRLFYLLVALMLLTSVPVISSEARRYCQEDCYGTCASQYIGDQNTCHYEFDRGDWRLRSCLQYARQLYNECTDGCSYLDECPY